MKFLLVKAPQSTCLRALKERRIYSDQSKQVHQSGSNFPDLTGSCSDSDSESSLFPLPLPGTLRALLYAA